MKRRTAVGGTLYGVFGFASFSLVARPARASDESTLRALRAILETPEEQIDFAKAKVAIDRLVDPAIDAEATLARIDEMVRQVKAMLPPHASGDQRAGALRAYLYDPGPWNRGLVFAYNFAHPDGLHVPDKLLANYLQTRKGNCVSMPFLYIAMAQKLGLTVGAAFTPSHVFVKLRDDRGTWHNIEATSGGYTRRDILYQQDTPMTDRALATGIYMRPLGKRETLAAMAQVVAEHHLARKNYTMVAAVSQLVLERNPMDVNAMVNNGHAHAMLIRQRYVSKCAGPNEIPADERDEYRRLRTTADHWYDKAEALGWRMPTKEDDARYLANVKGATSAAKR